MTKDELNQARTDPDFLNYLETSRVDALENEKIAVLYEVLDSLLILDLEEDKIDEVYESILKISFKNIEQIVNQKSKLKLENNELFYTRSLYEHAIEKWSCDDEDGAKQLFYLLSKIVDDEKFVDAINMHLIACSKNYTLDSFYDNMVDTNSCEMEEKYGYFIIHFKENTKEYIKQNLTQLKIIDNNLKHLLD